MTIYTQDFDQNIHPIDALIAEVPARSPSERAHTCEHVLEQEPAADHYCRTCGKTFRFATKDVSSERDGCPHCCSCDYIAVRYIEIEYFEDLEDTGNTGWCANCGGSTDHQDLEGRKTNQMNTYSQDAEQNIQPERAHTCSHVLEQEQDGMSITPWLTDTPYTADLIERFNNTTHFDKCVDKENRQFAVWAAEVTKSVTDRLSRYGVQGIPPDVQTALDRLRQAEYDYFHRYVRSREMAPPWSVTGRANYSKFARPEKAEKHVRRGIEQFEEAKERLEKSVNRYSPRMQNRISGDDPHAPDKLRNRIAEQERLQETMKRRNKMLKMKNATPLQVLGMLTQDGMSEQEAQEFIIPEKFGGPGYPSFCLTNNNANIRRLKERLVFVEQQQSHVTKEAIVADIRVIDNVAENRIQIEFPGKPSEEQRASLKKYGFRWSPSTGVWQQYRSPQAAYRVAEILGIEKLNWSDPEIQGDESETALVIVSGPATGENKEEMGRQVKDTDTDDWCANCGGSTDRQDLEGRQFGVDCRCEEERN